MAFAIHLGASMQPNTEKLVDHMMDRLDYSNDRELRNIRKLQKE